MRRQFYITRPDPSIPWGFRIQGGRDFGQHLIISAVTNGGLVESYGVRAGARVISIGGDLTSSMTHQQAQQAIIRCGNELQLETMDSSDCVSEVNISTPVGVGPARQSVMVTAGPLRLPSSMVQQPQACRTESWKNYGANPYNPSAKFEGVVSSHSETIELPQTITSFQRQSPRFNRISDQVLTGDKYTSSFTPSKSTNVCETNLLKPTSAKNPLSISGSSWSKAAVVATPKASERRPVCYSCKREIHGPFVDTMKYCFCPDHFVCCQCHAPLKDQPFAEQDDQFYCVNDFVNSAASRCAKCDQPIIGTVTLALDKSWHPHCFVCSHCNKPLQEKFHLEDAGTFLCEEHWNQLHLTTCDRCGEPISEIDRYMEACGKQFHVKCFCCAACKTPLEGKPFHTRDNRPFCRAHAFAVALYN
ncbi:hypothetical protein AHF37_10530 [Paragonimus kellicotti]|nr:hypothetical protein AHF37_10530 [Paragonimus kellicotti]